MYRHEVFNLKLKMVYAWFLVLALLAPLILPAMADTSLSDQAFFHDPLGDPNGWSFEGDPNGWTADNGGYRTSSPHLDGNYSWYTSGGGEYYMWRYVDASHALNAIKGKKVKFSFSFDPEVTIMNGGFETGDLSSWETGGAGDHRRTWEDAHNGGYSMLIGYNYTSPVADSRDWCYQTVTVPTTAKNTIFSFWYHLFTEDKEDWNWLEVYIRDSSGNNLAQVFKKGGVDYPGLEEYGWDEVTYNLTSYAGQTIQIYFAVVNMYDTSYKTWCYIDDVVIENEARAGIYYEYTTGGGGGGCPHVSVWNGMQYVLDNNVMPLSESTVGDVVDYYLLQQPLVPDGEGLYGLMLSEFEEEHSFFDQVQLLAIDHPSSVNVAVSPCGEILTHTSPYAAVSAITNDKENAKFLLNVIDGDYYEGYNGSYITLNFGDELDVSRGAKLVMRTDYPPQKIPSIHVQVQDEGGNWNDVATVTPRVYWATEIIDLSEYLPDPKGDLKARLYFTADHKIDFVGLDISPQAAISVQQAELVSAKHSKNSDPTIYGSPLETEVKSKLLDDDAYAELLPGEQIELAFAVPEASDNLARNFVLVSKGHYHTLPAGTLIDPTVYGPWIAPTSYDFHIAEVVADLPSTTTSVKVIIHGRSDFKAYIDNAILTITDTKTVTADNGALSVSFDIISWRQEPVTYGSRVIAAVSLAAYPKSPYQIRTIKLQTELVPSTQDAKLHIEYAGQENDANHEVDPAAVEEYQYFVFSVITEGISIAAGAAAGLVVGHIFPPGAPAAYLFVSKIIAGTTTKAAVKYALGHFASNPDNKDAGVGYQYSAVWEEWPYPTYRKEYETWSFVSVASGNYELEWKFNEDSADTFQIKTTAWVNWGESVYHQGAPEGFDYYTLDDRGWTDTSTTFTVGA